jgi:hypothetical protein
MKQFNNITLKTEYENQYGETMILILDELNEMWFYHSDCNTDFESLTEFIIAKENGKWGFPYILNKSERLVVQNFIITCDEMIGELT